MAGTYEPADPDLIRALRAGGYRVTAQRLLLHRHLRTAAGHLTAEELAQRASSDVPGLSLPTVYAALDLLCALGFARRIAAGGPARFEVAGAAHHHRRCGECGRIDDIQAEVSSTPLQLAANRDGFVVDGMQILFTGTCAHCRGGPRRLPRSRAVPST